MITSYHTPVLLKEAIEALKVESGKKYIDATVGGGGHGVEIIRRGGVLLGIDQDPEAVLFAKQNVKCQMTNDKWKNTNWRIVQGNFREIQRIATENGFSKVDGILFDLGVSSHQFDTPGRGFSYRFEGTPLDMRLDQSKGITAKELLETAHEEELYEIFAKFGEEKHSRAIAHALVLARQVSPIVTAGQLQLIIEKEILDKRHLHAVASRIFQALRIAVNDELDALREGLKGAIDVVCRGGRIVVISFHSLEDRMVKQTMRRNMIHILTKKPVLATQEEIHINPRARSAKLRAGEKL